MASDGIPYGRKTQQTPKVKEVHILWITAGLGCDGDSVSITAASQPSLEDVILGAIPGLPKVHLHNPVLSYENGEEFLVPFHQASRGELDNFVLVVEGSIPNEKISGEGRNASSSGIIGARPASCRRKAGATGPRRLPGRRGIHPLSLPRVVHQESAKMDLRRVPNSAANPDQALSAVRWA